MSESLGCLTVRSSARVVKILTGDGTTFHADVRRDGQYTCKGMVYAEMFYGVWCCFTEGWHPPSTRVLVRSVFRKEGHLPIKNRNKINGAE